VEPTPEPNADGLAADHPAAQRLGLGVGLSIYLFLGLLYKYNKIINNKDGRINMILPPTHVTFHKYRHILVLDTSVFTKSNIHRKEVK
jgi:hypothetical protein